MLLLQFNTGNILWKVIYMIDNISISTASNHKKKDDSNVMYILPSYMYLGISNL